MSEKHESASLVKTLRPFHIWALGVGIVLVGEYMGWNFTFAKGRVLGSLLAMLVAGTMYVCHDFSVRQRTGISNQTRRRSI